LQVHSGFDEPIASGSMFPTNITVAIEDYYGQTVLSDYTTVVDTRVLNPGRNLTAPFIQGGV